MNTQLENKTILVTGASGGIGSAIVKLLVKEGANVIIHYNSNKQSAEELAKHVSQMNGKTMLFKADLTSETDVVNMFDAAKNTFGRIDGLVNNAGIWPDIDTPLWEMTLSQWNNTLSTNLTSIFLCSREFIRNLKENRGNSGSVVLIGSTAGVFGEHGHIDYSSSKSALHGFMLSLKNEIVRVAKYGRVNMISPGWTLTPMAEAGLQDKNSVVKVLQTTALRKIGRAEDIASSTLFLLSDSLSGHITGQNIVVAGGMEGRRLFTTDEVDPDNV